MKTKEEIAIAIGGLITLSKSKDLTENELILAKKQLDILLWVLDYPNDFKMVYKGIEKLGITSEYVFQKLDETKAETDAILNELKSKLDSIRKGFAE